MKGKISTLIVLLFLLIIGKTTQSQEQDVPVHPIYIGTGVFHGETPALRDIPPMTEEEYQKMVANAKNKLLNPKLQNRSYPFADQATPKGPDPVWQREMGTVTSESKAPIANFSGQTSPYYPSDCNGTAGHNHFMQTINSVYCIYNKNGTIAAGPANMNTLFSGVTGATYNDGDPLILFDEMAQRWLAVEFSISGTNDYMLIAVSTTSDPTGTWYKYSFDVDDTPDYEKFGIWQDGYYMGVNNASSGRKDTYVFQRSVMLTGGASPTMIGFDNPNRPTTIDGFMCVPPLDNDGPAAPAGSPGIFITINDNAIGGGSDQLWIYELTANWTTPASSTFTRVQQINVAAFDSNFGTNWANLPQLGTTQKIDAIPMVVMNPPQYRNFGSYQTIVCCHTVDVDATNHAGIRWYELRRGTELSGNWTIRQQGTYAPDANSRWMGSIMLNGSGQIGLGYSITSSTMYPSIRYTGQSSSAYASASGILDIAEGIIHNATSSQSSYDRWGDYAGMSVDPSDDQTFWFTTQYGGSRQTKIASFKLSFNPGVASMAATSITPTSAVLNGTVNPNGLATTYHFEWGTTESYGNSTPNISAGSGTSAISVNETITGLVAGTTYHFRLVATNSDGTGFGSNLSFKPGTIVLTSTAATSITGTTAVAGGNITSNDGVDVTARGTCWSTSENPTIADSHTTDGVGLGTFTSNLTGLVQSTTYHFRAYATNITGTYYGNDLTFQTSCGTVSNFPFVEGFENAGVIPNCWTQEQVSSSGIFFTFLTGNGAGYPAAAHTGTYNACLKDATTADNKTKLITPPLNISALISPTLTFWHTQIAQSGRQDQLVIFYKTSAAGTWTQLASYTAAVADWTQRTISLPNGSSDYYIAFEGNAKYGRGVCIDDISVTGTNPSLTVTPSNQNVTAAAGSTTFNVTTTVAWTASSNLSWCTVTPSGTGNGTITANYEANTTFSSRIAQITVSGGGATPVTVTVTQAGLTPTLSVSPSNQAVTANAGVTTFNVTSNTSWTSSSNQAWCVIGSGGSGNGVISANYAQNTSVTSRVAEITVTVSGLTPIVVTVTQAGATPTLTVTPSNQPVTYIAGNTSFNVTSNTTWTSVSNQTWCTVGSGGSGNGTITANFTQNTTYITRIAQITVTVTGLTPVVVTVTQGGTPCLTPTAFAGNDATICQSSVYPLSGATATNNGSLLWSATGTGTFNNATILNPVYTPGVADYGTTVVFTLLVQAVNQCTNPATDISELLINKVPTAYAGEDATILDYVNLQLTGTATNYQSVAWTSSGDGYFDNSANPITIYHPGNNDINNSNVVLTLTALPNDPCTQSASDALSVTIIRQQNVEIPSGWSGFSSFVVPFNPEFADLMDPVSGNVEISKTLTQVYWPEYGINTIGNFDVHQGYYVKLTEPATLPVTGFNSTDRTVNLMAGWNIIPVISSNPVNHQVFISQLGANLIIVTEVGGNKILWPAEGIYSLDNFIPGKAYLIKVTNNCSFTFPN